MLHQLNPNPVIHSWIRAKTQLQTQTATVQSVLGWPDLGLESDSEDLQPNSLLLLVKVGVPSAETNINPNPVW